MKFIFSKIAEKQFYKLDNTIQLLIIEMLTIYKTDEARFSNAIKGLRNLSPATHRIRIGNYRLICEIHENRGTCDILKIGHRKDVYK